MKMLSAILSGFVVGAIIIYLQMLKKEKIWFWLKSAKLKSGKTKYFIILLLAFPIALHLLLTIFYALTRTN